MPTITALALVEHRPEKPSPLPPPSGLDEAASSLSRRGRSPQSYSISPALYATPHPSPSCSSPPTSTSPGVLNRKRCDTILRPASADVGSTDGVLPGRGSVIEESARGRGEEEEEEEPVKEEGREVFEKGFDGNEEEEEVMPEDFFDPRESMSAASSSEAEDGSISRRNWFQSRTPLRNQSEFYDAADYFFSDGSVTQSSPSFSMNLETEVHTLRVSLLEEIQRRDRAEKALQQLHSQWQRMASCLSQVGLSFPKIQYDEDSQLETDPESFCQGIVVARLVSEAVESGIARAEAEEVAEAVIDSKNHEISRLQDRLQFYEAVNREMSQRNQEIIELARQKRLRTRQKWLWSCIGLSITVGASMLAYSYLPHFGGTTDPSPTSCPDAAASLASVEAGKK